MKKKYELTPEHREQLKPWADKWVANAMSTKAMDDADRSAMIEAIRGLYAAANLPPPNNIVFVASPRIMALAGTIAAGVWHLRRDDKFLRMLLGGAATRAATYAATRAATADATNAATDAATNAATRAATNDATNAATDDATYDATYAATNAATRAATYDATDAATNDATNAATYDATYAATPLVRWLLTLPPRWTSMYNGGNMWSGWVAFMSFFRHVAKLDLPEYEKWKHYESAAVHGGYRIMTPEFTMVSDRPSVLLVDSQNRPHCDTGPSHVWRDGWSLYYYHGIAIPRGKAWIITNPEQITALSIDAEENAEIRRVMVEKYGAGRYLQETGAQEVQRDAYGILLKKQIGNETLLSVRVVNSTPEPDGTLSKDDVMRIYGKWDGSARPWWDVFAADPEDARYKEYFLQVHPELCPILDPMHPNTLGQELGAPQSATAHNAVAASFGKTGKEYRPEVET